ncbi:MAG: DUF92 domain-containing protein [Anaerolineales bacterium]
MWDNILTVQLGYGILLSLIICGSAWWMNALSISGAWAAFVLGALVFGIGGWSWSAVLITFFITSSLLSHLFKKQKQQIEAQIEKGSRRDWAQVLANGGVAMFCVLLKGWFPHSPLPFLAASASLAAANADTWGTELGVLSSKPPRLITTAKIVDRGVSGGVSVLGLIAALAGSILIATIYWFFENNLYYFLLVCLSGFVGSLIDSLLGASLQVVYFCPRCKKETEKHPLHSCNEKTTYRRGWKWLNNDVVNLACTMFAAIFALIFAF